MSRPFRLCAMISGGGRTLMNIMDHIESGALDASVDLVIATSENIPGVQRARDRGLTVRIETSDPFETTRWIKDADVDLVCMCGYLRLLKIDSHLKDRVINIHPALLPDFGGKGMYGMRVHRAVLAAGRTVSGCTVHFVDEAYDRGPIILQRTCPVLADDTAETLAARVFEQECIAYPQAIQLFISGRISLESGRVCIRSADCT